MNINATTIDRILDKLRMIDINIPVTRALRCEDDDKYVLRLGEDDEIDLPKDIYVAYLNGKEDTVNLNRMLVTWKRGKFSSQLI